MKRYAFFVLLGSLVSMFAITSLAGTGTLLGSEGINPLSVAYVQNSPQDAWSTMALAAAGADIGVMDHLKSVTGNTATDYERTILAITAGGNDPRTFGDENLIARLKTDFYTDRQIGVPTQINDDIFGILALVSAGEKSTSDIIQDARDVLVNNQNTDGGWSWTMGGNSDTNDTAMALAALTAIGFNTDDQVIAAGLKYIRRTQNGDGGFPYADGSDSDGASTAWVISMLNALEINPTAWSSGDTDPIRFLESLRTDNGSYKWIEQDEQGSLFVTNYAVVALSGSGYPVGSIAAITPNVLYSIEGSGGILCEGVAQVATALDVVIAASEQCGFTYTIVDSSFGQYVSRIGDDIAGGTTGWVYKVNNISPDIGASVYALTDGDNVEWLFATFDFDNDATSKSLTLQATVVPYSGGGTGGTDGDTSPDVAFSIDQNTLDFGSLAQGQAAQAALQITNTGASAISISAQVEGDDLFTSHLSLDADEWQSWQSDMAIAQSKNVQVGLDVPLTQSTGSHAGQLTFWATGQ